MGFLQSRKGKGRQSLGFGSKSQRAQFHQEWQARVYEDYYTQRRQQQRQQQDRQKYKLEIKQRPKAGLQNSLRRLIAERQYWDRVEDRNWVYQHAAVNPSNKRLVPGATATATAAAVGNAGRANQSAADLSPPGWLVFHSTQSEEIDCFAQEFWCSDSGNEHDLAPVPTLQALSLQVLARNLPEYLEALGNDQLHHYLSLLPGPALSVLSVLVSRAGNMTDEMCQVLARHGQITRLSIVACRMDHNETDPSFKSLKPDTALEALLPKFSTNLHPQDPSEVVPDSWEDLLEEDDERHNNFDHLGPVSWKGCWHLERLELGNMPLLDVDLLKEVLNTCPRLTHLGLAGSLTYDRGPDVLWQLSNWVPYLQMLDVSGNSSWITEPLLRSVYESYQALQESEEMKVALAEHDDTRTVTVQRRRIKQLVIKATGCLTRSSQIMMEMEYGTIFQATTNY